MKLYNLGSLNIDYVYAVPHFVRPGETLSSTAMQRFPGGKGLNQSVALARAGASVVHGGFIGADGTFLTDILRQAGVDVSGIGITDGTTGHAIIQVDENGQNCILLYAGANHCFTEAYARQILREAEPGDILLLQNEINALDVLFSVAKEKQLRIAFNPSPFDASLLSLPLHTVHWWLLNEIEGAGITGKTQPEAIADALTTLYPDAHIVLTLGAEGALYAHDSQRIRQAAVPVKAVDTTACGDTFTGFFLAAVAAGTNAATAMALASRAASVTASRLGASVSIPHISEIIG